MEKFSLEKYLENPSRKVVTRDGRVVKILDTEFESGNGNKSVLAKRIYNNKAAVYVYTTDGKANNIGETENDLFFADEEEELTEFEKEVVAVIREDIKRNIGLKYEARNLLNLARKELEKDSGEKCISTDIEQNIFDNMTNLQKCFVKMFKYADYHGMVNAIKQFSGLTEALIKKDLPKWKKATKHKDLEKHIAILEENKVLLSNYLEEGDCYIYLEDLKKLPKEE